MDPSKQTKPLQSPKLNTLPSELRKLIVSYLAPTCAEEMKPGCKLHLKNANLTHSCLREWVPEYMFRDMALTHVLPGASSHLEIFSLIKENAHLLKHVKHINVRVPPGIRWEIGLNGPVSMFGIEQYTQQRLCRKFGVEAIEGMLDEQLDYCTEYHEAMVAPFVENQGWFRLFRSANSTFPRVFSRFENLATLSVGCCERTDMPQPTITNTFMLQYGKSAAYEVYPNFVEDATINMAWASCSIMRSAPPSVRNLQVSLANMDCSPRTATINRLLSISYRYSPGGMDSPRPNITRLCLSIRGVSGTHGERESQGDAETAGAVNAWSLEINMMPCLQHLELIDDLSTTNNIKFSNLANSDIKASILPWLLSRVFLYELLTLRLSKFTLRKNDLQEALSVKWPKVEKIVLDNVQLRIESASSDAVAATEHHDEWINACNFITGKQPGVQLELHNTACIVEGELTLVRIQQKQYADELSKIPGVVLVL